MAFGGVHFHEVGFEAGFGGVCEEEPVGGYRFADVVFVFVADGNPGGCGVGGVYAEYFFDGGVFFLDGCDSGGDALFLGSEDVVGGFVFVAVVVFEDDDVVVAVFWDAFGCDAVFGDVGEVLFGFG